jgi:hypothetical protein
VCLKLYRSDGLKYLKIIINIYQLKRSKNIKKNYFKQKKTNNQTALPNKPKHVESIIKVKIHMLERRLARAKTSSLQSKYRGQIL